MSIEIKISLNDGLYLKEPQDSKLGRNIIKHSILMIDEFGFEFFTFKKLAKEINSTEASIYRYFENKHKLLLYLTSWYWGWLEYQLVFATNGIADKKEKLSRAIEIVTKTTAEDNAFSHINEVLLNKIVINEYSKSYLTKEVDTENKEGYFVIYKRLVDRLKEMIKNLDAEYAYPSSLASTILEGSLHQHFLKNHFVSLTDCRGNDDLGQYFSSMVFSVLKS